MAYALQYVIMALCLLGISVLLLAASTVLSENKQDKAWQAIFRGICISRSLQGTQCNVLILVNMIFSALHVQSSEHVSIHHLALEDAGFDPRGALVLVQSKFNAFWAHRAWVRDLFALP